MEVEIKIQDCPKPHAVIYAHEITEEVRKVADYARGNTHTLIGISDNRSYVLGTGEVTKAAVENGRTFLYTRDKKYACGKRLYEIRQTLGGAFVQISKSVIVKISECESVETDFGGMLLLHLKSGGREYVSRHYVPEFKKSIGM